PPPIAPPSPSRAVPTAPAAITGPSPGTITDATAGSAKPAERPAAPPTTAPIAVPMPSGSASSSGTARTSLGRDPGARTLVRERPIPASRSPFTAPSADSWDGNVPTTVFMVLLLSWLLARVAREVPRAASLPLFSGGRRDSTDHRSVFFPGCEGACPETRTYRLPYTSVGMLP